MLAELHRRWAVLQHRVQLLGCLPDPPGRLRGGEGGRPDAGEQPRLQPRRQQAQLALEVKDMLTPPVYFISDSLY